MKVAAWGAGILGAVVAAVLSHWAIQYSGISQQKIAGENSDPKKKADQRSASAPLRFYYFCSESTNFYCTESRSLHAVDEYEAKNVANEICSSIGYNITFTGKNRESLRDSLDKWCKR